MEENLNYEEIIMTIIAHAGSARTLAMQAIKSAKNNNLENSYDLLEKSNQEFLNAHKIQTKLIEEEIKGRKVELSLLMVHAQDHLMNAMTVKELAEEFISIYKKINRG